MFYEYESVQTNFQGYFNVQNVVISFLIKLIRTFSD